MTRMLRPDPARARLISGSRYRALSLKALSFGVIGLINTAVDYGVFLLARAALNRSPAALSAIASFAGLCHCGSSAALALIAPNLVSWSVAVSGSYVMNSAITFAAESQGRLRWRAYCSFVLAGVAGLFANTMTLVFAAQILLLPVWLSKALAIVASFVVNFLLSHFIVFRVGRRVEDQAKSGL